MLKETQPAIPWGMDTIGLARARGTCAGMNIYDVDAEEPHGQAGHPGERPDTFLDGLDETIRDCGHRYDQTELITILV